MMNLTKEQALASLKDNLKSPRWRLYNLYKIADKKGNIVTFNPNPAQRKCLDDRHTLNVILKARQLGFSTLIELLMLDKALFTPNFSGYVIAHGLKEAQAIFKTKFKDPYDRLPPEIREAFPVVSSTSTSMSFWNGSSVSVGVSARSGTAQWLHISEFGKICARFPDKAREIVTGALNAVDAGQRVDIESTAEGQHGYFYDMAMDALSNQRRAEPLTDLDYKFHFFPWWENSGYTMESSGDIPEPDQRYFDMLQREHGITLTDGQKHWYVKKKRTQQDDMKREYPSYPEEAFEQAIEGAYYAKQLALADEQQRIIDLPYSSSLPVHTAWDIGIDDDTAIWFFQVKPGGFVDFIDYYEMNGEGLEHYYSVLRQRGYTYGTHYMPHDAENDSIQTGKSTKKVAEEMGIKPVKVVPRTENVQNDINFIKSRFGQLRFSKNNTDEGLRALRSYTRAWNEKHGVFSERPLHNWASHASDAFRTAIMGIPKDVEQANGLKSTKPKRQKQKPSNLKRFV